MKIKQVVDGRVISPLKSRQKRGHGAKSLYFTQDNARSPVKNDEGVSLAFFTMERTTMRVERS